MGVAQWRSSRVQANRNGKTTDARKGEGDMLWTILVVLLVLWLLGLIGGVGGSLIHLILVVALVILVINLLTGRRTV
jgi:hypothetical protein